MYEPGSHLVSSGALATLSGALLAPCIGPIPLVASGNSNNFHDPNRQEHESQQVARHLLDHMATRLLANGLKEEMLRFQLFMLEAYRGGLSHLRPPRFVPSAVGVCTLRSLSTAGAKTGRTPKDKRVVRDPATEKDIWWAGEGGTGSPNYEMDQRTFLLNRERAVDYLNMLDRLYVFDGYAGWDPEVWNSPTPHSFRLHRGRWLLPPLPTLCHYYQPSNQQALSRVSHHDSRGCRAQSRIKIRVVCARAYHCLFMHNMLIRPTEEQLANFGDPDFTILNGGAFPCNRYTSYMTSSSSVDIDLGSREIVRAARAQEPGLCWISRCTLQRSCVSDGVGTHWQGCMLPRLRSKYRRWGRCI